MAHGGGDLDVGDSFASVVPFTGVVPFSSAFGFSTGFFNGGFPIAFQNSFLFGDEILTKCIAATALSGFRD